MLVVFGVILISTGVILTVVASRLLPKRSPNGAWLLVQFVAIPLSALVGIGFVTLLIFLIDGGWREFGADDAILAAVAGVAGYTGWWLCRRGLPVAEPTRQGALPAARAGEKRAA